MSDQSHGKEGGGIVILAIIFLTAFIVVGVTYSVYLFIESTRISRLADVHITKSLLMASNRAQGRLYSDEKRGIKDWVVYTDKANGFEMKYPPDYKLQPSSPDRLLTLTRNNASQNGLDSLSNAVYISVKEATKNSVKEELKSFGIEWNDNWKQEEIGGRMGIKTGEIEDESGRVKELVFWQFGGKIFVLEEYHFNEDHVEEKETFEKILSEFKFI